MRSGMRFLAATQARNNRDDMDRTRMGGEEMESRFRDRQGREHYDNGRFTPMRNEMGYDGPYSGGNKYDIDIKRYEYEPEGNYRNGRGGYDSDRKGATEHKEEPGMRMIGFDRNIEMTGGHSKQSHGLRALPGGSKTHHEAKMDEHTAREWAAMLENEDGTTGPHWTIEQVKKVMEQKNLTGDPVTIWLTMNMMYSDYCRVAKKLGVNTTDFYAEMAKAFLEDKDAGAPDKLTAYYEYIVKG